VKTEAIDGTLFFFEQARERAFPIEHLQTPLRLMKQAPASSNAPRGKKHEARDSGDSRIFPEAFSREVRTR